MAAKFRLDEVKAAVRAGSFELGCARASVKLSEWVNGTYSDCLRFVQALTEELTESDFAETLVLREDEVFDVYARRASNALIRQFGLVVAAWYVKLTVWKGQYGDVVFFLSVHPLERAIDRVGGTLKPEEVDE